MATGTVQRFNDANPRGNDSLTSNVRDQDRPFLTLENKGNLQTRLAELYPFLVHLESHVRSRHTHVSSSIIRNPDRQRQGCKMDDDICSR